MAMSILGEYKDNMCHYNCIVNKKYAFRGLNLKIVGGGLGLDGWFEFGGKNWKLKDYMKKPTDIHFWLEDDEGNVYDYIQPSWNLVAKVRGRYSRFPNIELRGMSKAEIKRLYKIEYVPAQEIVYKVMYKKVCGFGIDLDEKQILELLRTALSQGDNFFFISTEEKKKML